MYIYIHTYIHIGELQGIKSYSETVTRGTRVSVESFYVPYVSRIIQKILRKRIRKSSLGSVARGTRVGVESFYVP
jgi:hypothetical protein